MTGGGRAPAVAHERAEKQDLGLDASSHFAGEGVLHSLTSLLRRRGWVGGCGLLSSYPSLTSLEPHSFLFSSLLKPLSFWRMCAASPSNAAPGGVQEHSSPEETQGPLVAGCRARSKVGMKGGICGPFSFRPKKALSISELHYTWLQKFQTTRTNDMLTTQKI